MKSPFLIFLAFICTNLGTAQIKIGDNPQTLDSASLLELESNSKVLVISRMSEAEILGLSPLQGAMVYNTDASCIFYYDGTNWNNLCSGGSTGSIAWGAITGNLTDQTDLAAEFQKYVDLATAQSIAGEKTLTEKFTVDTGTITDQVAEFLGRVKGEDGTAPEDFVTKAQLDASGGGGGGSWGSITGTLANQTDLAAEFQNYVDLTTAQSIAGEKTLTEKFTVDTGTATDQAAEFLGRVKGENGTAPEDFVTKLQLDAVSATGASGQEGSIFFAGTSNQLTENNAQLFWDNTINQLRVGDNALPNPTNSTLNVQGSVSKAIKFGETQLNETHHTILINDPNITSTVQIELPDPKLCAGRVYIIKKLPTITMRTNWQYLDTDSVRTNDVGVNVLHLQSNGFEWEQIN